MYIYIYIHTCVYIYIYICNEGEDTADAGAHGSFPLGDAHTA